MRIMVSGSREYEDYEFLRAMLEDAAGDSRDVTVVHGAARGADRLAGEAADEYGFKVEVYPADWSVGRRAGPIRNAEMLSKNIDVVLAFFKSGLANVGTRDAVKAAARMKIPVRYFIDNSEFDLNEMKRRIVPF